MEIWCYDSVIGLADRLKEIVMSALKIGDKVNYHCFAGGNVSSFGHVVTDIALAPNDFDEDVAWISGKCGCISLEHLSINED